MFTVSLHSVGCLPYSDSYPVTFETLSEAWDFVAEEVELIEDDGDFLAAHTALHLQDRGSCGAIPADENGVYRFAVEPSEHFSN